jgi:hypothetical protein
MAHAEPTSAWQPPSAPEIEAFFFTSEAIAAAVRRKRRMPAASAPGTNRR